MESEMIVLNQHLLEKFLATDKAIQDRNTRYFRWLQNEFENMELEVVNTKALHKRLLEEVRGQIKKLEDSKTEQLPVARLLAVEEELKFICAFRDMLTNGLREQKVAIRED